MHDFAHLNSFELADVLKKKMSCSNNNALHVLIADISFLYPIFLCVNFSLFIQTFGDAQIDEICETTAAEEFKSLFHLTC